MRVHKYVHVLKKKFNEENNYTYKSKFGRKVLVCMYATTEMLTFFENFCKRGIIIVGIAVVSPMPGNEVVKIAISLVYFYGVARHNMQKKHIKIPFF